MKKIIRLTESDISRIVRKVIREQKEMVDYCQDEVDAVSIFLRGKELPPSCMASDMKSNCIKDVIGMVPFPSPELLIAINDLVACRRKNPDFKNADDLWGEQGV